MFKKKGISNSFWNVSWKTPLAIPIAIVPKKAIPIAVSILLLMSDTNYTMYNACTIQCNVQCTCNVVDIYGVFQVDKSIIILKLTD